MLLDQVSWVRSILENIILRNSFVPSYAPKIVVPWKIHFLLTSTPTINKKFTLSRRTTSLPSRLLLRRTTSLLLRPYLDDRQTDDDILNHWVCPGLCEVDCQRTRRTAVEDHNPSIALIASNRVLSLAPRSEWTLLHDNPWIIESLQWCEKKKTTNQVIECPNLLMLS